MNLLETRRGRLVLFTCLYVSEGAPIGFIWWALPAILRHRGGAVEKITTVLAVVTLMWALKFLWAPLVDALRTPRWGFRSWIMTAQLFMGLALIPVIWLDPMTDLTLLAALLVVHAFCATTQDVSIDALAINTVPQTELGTVNGCMQAGKFFGRSLFGGVALVVADAWGWHWIVVGLIGAIWLSLLLLLLVTERVEPAGAGVSPAPGLSSRFNAFGQTLRSAFSTPATWFALAFALTSGAAFEATGALSSPYLVDRGVSLQTIGWFRAVPVVGAMILGAFAGGIIADRLGRTKSPGIFLVGFVVTILVLGLVEAGPAFEAKATVLMIILTVMYLFFGLFIAASYALFMSLTDPKLGATQFSTFMGATNGCESWSTWAGGQIVARWNYATAFFVMCAVSLLSLPLLKLLGRRRAD